VKILKFQLLHFSWVLLQVRIATPLLVKVNPENSGNHYASLIAGLLFQGDRLHNLDVGCSQPTKWKETSRWLFRFGLYGRLLFIQLSKHCAVSASQHKNKPHLLALRFEVKADVHLPFSLIEIDQTECLLMNLGWLTFWIIPPSLPFIF